MRVKPRRWVLLLGIGLLPVYIFSSGGMQPSHLVLTLFSVMVFARLGLKLELWSWLLLGLAVWVLCIESVKGDALGANPKALLNFLYFFYNFTISCAIARQVEQDDVAPVVFGIMIATSIVIFSIAISGIDLRELGEDGRETATFNNPNQLGYFSVCLLAATYLLYASKSITYSVAISLYGLSLLFSIISLSKAAIISNGVVLLFAFKPRFNKLALILFLLSALAVAYILYSLYLIGAFDQYLFAQRVVNMMNEQDSSLESRGYLVFLKGDFSDVIFGMGSNKTIYLLGYEVHSTFGSVFINYGLVGLGFILGIVFFWIKKIYIHFGAQGVICIAGPPLLYGLTHNGTRFVLFWALIATTLGTIGRLRVIRSSRKVPGS